MNVSPTKMLTLTPLTYELFFQNTVNDLINAWGVYLILGVQEGAFNSWEAFKRERRLFS